MQKTSSAVRVSHKPSGAVGESRDGRSQEHNRQAAFRKMAETKEFQAWLKLEIARVSGRLKSVEQEVEKAMNPANIRIEIHEDDKWVVTDEEHIVYQE